MNNFTVTGLGNKKFDRSLWVTWFTSNWISFRLSKKINLDV